MLLASPRVGGDASCAPDGEGAGAALLGVGTLLIPSILPFFWYGTTNPVPTVLVDVGIVRAVGAMIAL